jgi:hypothetical protein
MSNELTAVEESVTKVLLDLMTGRVMSKKGLLLALDQVLGTLGHI